MKIVIVGGVAGGASAAARLRRLDEKAQIVVFERSGYVSYANCGLPYYIGGVIEDKSELSLQTPESFWERFRIDVRLRHNVTAVNTGRKTVTVEGLDTGKVYEESYDKLILSPGAKPVRPELPGVDDDRIFTLRTVEDTLRIREFVTVNKPRSAVIAGGGFIGLEVAENLRELGMEVTIVQRPKQVLNPLDYDMAAVVHGELRKNGVRLSLGSSVTGFERQGDQVLTLLKDQPPLKADMVLLAIGVVPDSALAKAAGLELGAKGSIVVNSRMETSVPDIYAVGDAVELRHYITGSKALVALAGPANKQGRIAADNICGIDSEYKGAQGSSIIKLFNLTAASTGINEGAAQSAGLDYEKLVLSPSNHASYYPGGRLMTIKLLYERGSLRLLGAQIVGGEGVDKRIDVLSTAMRTGMKVTELAGLELSYAPPYSSAKDPVNIAGFMAENIEAGKVKQFHWQDVPALQKNSGVTLIDTRTPAEYAAGHAEGFVNMPVDDLRERIEELDRSRPVYVMCQSGQRSYIACRILSQNGFDCYNFSGGYRFYETVSRDRCTAENSWPCGMDR